MKRNKKCIGCGRSMRKRFFTILYTNAETRKWAKGNYCHECQTARRTVMTPEQIRRKEMNAYAARDGVLRSMGFASYADYLASETWKKIRLRVLNNQHWRCKLCGAAATCVHHNRYRRKELCGQSLKGMKALCADCHRRVEFDEGGKVGLNEASHRYYELAGSPRPMRQLTQG